MTEIKVRDLMEAGAHFGHRTRFWNPKMAPFIYGVFNHTHIINLDLTAAKLREAAEFLAQVGASKGEVLFVCAKRQAADIVRDEAERAGCPFVNHRWLGGLLTNFGTLRRSVDRLNAMELKMSDGSLAEMTKKEGIRLMLRRDKLQKSLGGVRELKDLPAALFIIDAGYHRGAIRECNKLRIPVIAVVDTNHSPEGVDYVIPGNDDSRAAIACYAKTAVDAILRGRERAPAEAAEEARQ